MPDIAVQGPYEAVVIELLKTVRVVLEGQPPDVRADLWRIYLEDLKIWRSFWLEIAKTLNIVPKG